MLKAVQKACGTTLITHLPVCSYVSKNHQKLTQAFKEYKTLRVNSGDRFQEDMKPYAVAKINIT